MATTLKRKPLATKDNSPANGEADERIKALVPKGMGAAFVRSKLHEKALEIAGLGAPDDWDGEMPELPNDIATLDHDQLSNLYAQFVNAFSTATWHASKNYIEADAYDEVAEYLENVALIDSRESNEPKRKADSRTQEGVVEARSLQKDAYRRYVRFRDLAKTLEARAKAVSRIGGFISDEAESEDVHPLRPSTRGNAAGSDRGSARGAARLKSRR